MRDTDERAAAIERRIRELKQKQEKKLNLLMYTVSTAVCLIIILSAAIIIPDLTIHKDTSASGFFNTAAGIFAESNASGYVLIGLLAFVLGCAVTIFCYRMKKREEEEKDDRDHR